jgi:hypothetical protein
MARTRVRIRFSKQDDLRFLGHHDLVRVWERLLRRADVRPAMSEGFSKRPRMNFPSALAVGIGGLSEVFELELEHDRDPDDLARTLNAFAPPGLSIVAVERMPEGARFSQPAAAEYELPVPADRLAAVQAEIERRRAATSGPHTADVAPIADASPTNDAAPPSAPAPIASDAVEPFPASVRDLELVDGTLRMKLRLGEAGAVRPRELLATLGLGDLETTGAQIVRTRVEVSG